MLLAWISSFFALQAPSNGSGGDVLVVADEHWKEQGVGDICQQSGAVASEKLEALGYFLYQKGKDRVFFAPGIWQADQIKRSISIYSKIATHIGTDGTLRLDDADVREFAQAVFATDGAELDSNSEVIIRLSRNYEMSNADKTVSVGGGDNRSNSDYALLRKHPVRYSGKPALVKHSQLDYVAVWPSSYTTFGFGKLRFSNEERLVALRSALNALEAHLAGYYRAKRDAYTALNSRVSGTDISQEYGKSFDSLPAAIRSELSGAMSTDYARYGFQSSIDAQNFLKGATLSNTNATSFLYVYIGDYSGTPQYLGAGVP